MKTKEKPPLKEYVPPKLTLLGTVREVTLGSPAGAFKDAGHTHGKATRMA
jgi:hypothetical protein